MKKFLFFATIFSFFGANLLSINLGVAQLTLFRVFILAALILYILKVLSGDKKYSIFHLKSSDQYPIAFLLIWLVYALISLAWARDVSAWTRQVYFLGIGVICVLLFYTVFDTLENIYTLLKLIQVGIIIQALIGIYEIFTGNYFFLESINIALYSMYYLPVAMIGNTNNFATLMLIGTGISLALTRIWKNKAMQLLSYSIIGLCTVLIFYSGSRANIVGLFLMAAFLMITSGKGFWAVLLVLAGVLVYIPDFSGFLGDTLNFQFNLKGRGSTGIRVNLIRNSVDFLIRTFGFGVGAGQAEYWMDHSAVYPTGGITNPHNWWIELLVNYGVIIFLGYLVFYIKLFSSNYRIWLNSNNRIEKMVSLSICTVMVGYLVGSFSSSSNMSAEWLWTFWAIVISWIKHCKSSGTSLPAI